MNISTAAELFITAHAGMNYNENSLKLYTRTLKLLSDFTSDKDITAITITDLRGFRASQGTRKSVFNDHPTKPTINRPISPYTVLGHVRRTKAFFTWLTEEEYLPVSPAKRLELPRLDQIGPKDMPAETVTKLIELAAGSIRDEAIIRLLADTGCRVGGVSRLNVADVDLTLIDGRAKATVIEKRRQRDIFYSAETAAIIKNWLETRAAAPGETALFVSNKTGYRLTGSGIYQVLKRLAKAEPETIHRFNPHSMRHATARRMIDHGGSIEDVSAVLGHTTSSVTKKFYSGWNNADTRRRHAMYANL
jgi:site-specific recombinase XerD